MALTKRTYTANETVITAENLNAIQDEIITNTVSTDVTDRGWSPTQKSNARAQIGAQSADDVSTAVNTAKTLVVTINNLAAQAYTASSSGTTNIDKVTADMVVVNSVLSNPAAQLSDLTITTAATQITVAGTISGTTNLTLYLEKPMS